MDLHALSISKLHDGYRSKDFTVADVVAAYKKNIDEQNDNINAFVEVFEDLYDEQIKKAQDMIDAGDIKPLTGVPIAIKDNILVQGKVSTGGSKILAGHTAAYDSDVARNLKDQGAIILGRTNMDEFAMGSSNETSIYGVVKNPLDESRVPGGSSGGSAAAVAMNAALVSLGSDTGGSIRQPAAFCGLVGLKPTYGSISRYGLMALASSLDIIGPFGKTVEDTETVFKALARHDEMDSTCISESDRAALHVPEKPKKLGVPRDLMALDGIDDVVRANFEESLKKLEGAGYELVDIELPMSKYALPVYYILQPAEASSNLARYDSIRYGYSEPSNNLMEQYMKTREQGFGTEVKRRILLGTYVLSHGYYDAYYNKANRVREVIRKDFERAFESVDAIVTPTTTGPAFKFGARPDPVSMYLEDLFTVSMNLAGIPAISVPSGRTTEGLPLGIQFIAPHLHEQTLFTIGKDFENTV